MKTALITGANAGLGLATAKALAQRNFNLILLCRDEQKGLKAKAEVQQANPAVGVELVLADLVDLDSVRAAAGYVIDHYDRLDVLINNAGYSPQKIEFITSEKATQGIEKSFFANHIGHFVLTYHLLPLLRRTAAQTGDVRVINLSSGAYRLGRKEHFFRRIDTLSTLQAYCDGKLANLLFAKGLALKEAGTGITAYAVHPGVVRTNFGNDALGFMQVMLSLARPFMQTPEKGAKTSVFLASAPLNAIGERNNGGYFQDSKPKAVVHRDISDTNADWLWEKSMVFV